MSTCPPNKACCQTARSSTVDTRAPAAYGRGAVWRGVEKTVLVVNIATGAQRDDLTWDIIATGAQTEGVEQQAFDRSRVGLARHLFDKDPEQPVAGVVVAIPLAGLEIEWRAREPGKNLRARYIKRAVGHCRPDRRQARDAGGMSEQLADRDGPSAGVVFGDEFAKIILEPQLPQLGKPQNGGSCELLGERSHPVDSFRTCRDAEFKICTAVSGGVNDPVITHNGDGKPCHRSGCEGLFSDAIDLGKPWPVPGSSAGRRAGCSQRVCGEGQRACRQSRVEERPPVAKALAQGLRKGRQHD